MAAFNPDGWPDDNDSGEGRPQTPPAEHLFNSLQHEKAPDMMRRIIATWPYVYSGVDMNATFELSDEITMGMLGAAAKGNNAAAVPALVRAGAAVRLRDINHAIYFAKVGHTEVLAALLAAGQPRPPGGDGGADWPYFETACPLWMAMRAAQEHGMRCAARMIELLLAAGYEPITYQEADGCCTAVRWQCSPHCSMWLCSQLPRFPCRAD